MTRNRRLLEAIDACRPGGDDLQQPDLGFLAAELSQDEQARALYQRTQQLDSAITTALNDVPIPAGLADRILASLANQVDTAAAFESPAPVLPDAPMPAERRFSRRWWVIGASGAGVAAAIAALVANLPSGPQVNKDNLADLTLKFFEAEPQLSVEPGQFVSQQAPPANFPLSTAVVASNQVRWRKIAGLFGAQGIAYDLAAPGGGPRTRATLYVVPVPSTLTGLGASPPRRPLATTAGVAISAWQVKGLLYVLAISGDEKRYQSFIRTQSLA